jgi:hypothetical protein
MFLFVVVNFVIIIITVIIIIQLNIVVEWLTLPIRIADIPGTNLGLKTGYPD